MIYFYFAGSANIPCFRKYFLIMYLDFVGHFIDAKICRIVILNVSYLPKFCLFDDRPTTKLLLSWYCTIFRLLCSVLSFLSFVCLDSFYCVLVFVITKLRCYILHTQPHRSSVGLVATSSRIDSHVSGVSVASVT